MSETNGHSESRLDRIEKILERHSTILVSIDAMIERQEAANLAAHERFEEEDKRLLTAQVLMNSALQKMADGMISLESKLNVLIETVDGIIRHKA